MNPRLQDMKSLLFMLPRIWHLEGKVVGADLGLGKFQFDFDDEEDITEVLKMEPFHFDRWMLSMVRWSPTVDPEYPSDITFWVRVIGVPFQFWAEPIFRSIGEDLGRVVAVDIDGGRVRVIVNGFKPLCFDTVIEFYNGEETFVSLQFERLFGYCKRCFSMCHASDHCPLLEAAKPVPVPIAPVEEELVRPVQSYKGAATSDRRKDKEKVTEGSGGAQNSDQQRSHKPRHASGNKGRAGGDYGEPFVKPRSAPSYGQVDENRHMARVAADVLASVGVPPEPQAQGEQGSSKGSTEQVLIGQDMGVRPQPPKRVRQPLFQDTNLAVVGDQVLALQTEPGGVTSETVDESTAPASRPPATTFQAAQEVVGSKSSGSLSQIVEGLDVGRENTPAAVVIPEDNYVQMVGPVASETSDSPALKEEGSANGGSGIPIDGPSVFPTVSDEELVESGDDHMDISDPTDASSSSNSLVDKGRKTKTSLALKETASKKLNVYLRATPKKRPAPKSNDLGGEGPNPKNQDKEKGPPGGSKPPKPQSNK
ncbi:PREDICTED: uncharacterized protein LOC109129331 [Camelina sativa]|uniref:Uncharacterized protein LOC109129331 n=1 Tax=Camelina sativa TaxID=90675 RepID=A0ABM1R1K8_CAMSA|nr:PREDICTED: uncharacterized protein LOC109129331 [Camelina sativa]